MSRGIAVTTARVFALILVLSLYFAQDTTGAERLSLTIPYKPEKATERISELRITIRGAWVISTPKVPKGWTIGIEDLGYELNIKGHATHGVGMEYPNFFTDFLVLETMDIDTRFDISAELKVDMGADSSTEKTVIFGKKDLNLKPIKLNK